MTMIKYDPEGYAARRRKEVFEAGFRAVAEQWISEDNKNCTDCWCCEECTDCVSCGFCEKCEGCVDCVQCLLQKNKQYCIDNIQYTKAEYEDFMKR